MTLRIWWDSHTNNHSLKWWNYAYCKFFTIFFSPYLFWQRIFASHSLATYSGYILMLFSIVWYHKSAYCVVFSNIFPCFTVTEYFPADKIDFWFEGCFQSYNKYLHGVRLIQIFELLETVPNSINCTSGFGKRLKLKNLNKYRWINVLLPIRHRFAHKKHSTSHLTYVTSSTVQTSFNVQMSHSNALF